MRAVPLPKPEPQVHSLPCPASVLCKAYSGQLRALVCVLGSLFFVFSQFPAVNTLSLVNFCPQFVRFC